MISIIVAIIISLAAMVFIFLRVIIETKSPDEQLLSRDNPGLPAVQTILQHPAVLFQDAIDRNQFTAFQLYPLVVESIAATGVAEFLVCAAPERLAAGLAIRRYVHGF